MVFFLVRYLLLGSRELLLLEAMFANFIKA